MNKSILYSKYNELEPSQKKKAVSILNKDLLENINDWEYKIHPIDGYNKTLYTVKYSVLGWMCDCQKFTSSQEICSHIGSVLLSKIREMNGG